MTAATQDVLTDKLGDEDIPDPALLAFPVEASTKIYGGTLVATNAAGNAVPAGTAGALVIWGRCEKQVDNSAGTAGALTVSVRKGPFYFANDGSIAQANIGQNAYAVDDNTVSLSDGGGTRLFAGVIYPIGETTLSLTTTSKVPVWVGLSNAYELAAGLATGGSARNVVTSLAAYTGSGTNTLTASANGAWAAQDGVTNAVGDTVFIQGGTTNLTAAKDSGPWVISSLGGAAAPWVLVRPSWFTTGSAIDPGLVIEVAGEGTAWAGTEWKSFAAPAKVVGTDDPTFYVGRVTVPVTLSGGTFTISTVGIRSATRSNLEAQLNTKGGTTTTTVGYGTIAAMTPGYAGTASAVVDAIASGQTLQSGDTSSLNVLITNW